MKSLGVVILFAIACCYVAVDRQDWKRQISSDKLGYYLYLPATFIYYDVGSLTFWANIKKQYPEEDRWFIYPQAATGRKVNKYTVGIALFEIPFFITAHIYSKVTQTYPADGFSVPYRLIIIISTIFWSAAGLGVLRKALLHFYSENVTWIVLACIAFGTNFYYYTAYEYGMSHNISFFLFATLLLFTIKWHQTYRLKQMLMLGLILGLIMLVRPVNIIIACMPVLWKAYSISSFKQKVWSLAKYRWQVLPAIMITGLVFIIQLLYWHYSSGEWLHYSYQGEYFDFRNPNIYKGLFSYRKGFFVYTPIAFLAILGYYHLHKQSKEIVLACLVPFVMLVYIVFSWKMWWYGGGFGSRPLIDFFPVLSLPLAALVTTVVRTRGVLLKTIPFVILGLFIGLNIFQSYQYSKGIIHFDRMSGASYWHVFGKTEINTDEEEKFLLPEKEYWREMGEIVKP